MVSITRWLRVPFVLLVVALSLAGSFGKANAATSTNDNTSLEQGLAKLQARFGQLSQQLDAANAYAAQLDGQLAEMRSRKQDTSRLAQSLAGFRNRLTFIRGALNTVQADLARRIGFDTAGRVTNADQAKITLNRIGMSLGYVTKLEETGHRNPFLGVKKARKVLYTPSSRYRGVLHHDRAASASGSARRAYAER